MKNITIPYTYILKCIATKEFYYGVRYAKECNPSEFWVTYFTSSKIIHTMIKIYGKENFEFSIRKTFTSGIAACKWEHGVINRMNLIERDDFINQSNGINFNANRQTIKGRKCFYDINLNRYRMLLPTDPKVVNSSNFILKGPPKTEEFKNNVRQKLTGRTRSKKHQIKINRSIKKYMAADVTGKTYEEIYGIAKATEIKNQLSKNEYG